MKCPYCGSDKLKVLDSRPTEENNSIRRRRGCDNCSKRFTTYETIESLPLIVIKKDNTREIYDRRKILAGLVRSCHKRQVSLQDIENLTNEIENKLYNSLEKEVKSSQIGEMVMQGLKELDEVAYVRFASIYREFRDINSFMNEIIKIKEER